MGYSTIFSPVIAAVKIKSKSQKGSKSLYFFCHQLIFSIKSFLKTLVPQSESESFIPMITETMY